MQLRFDNQEKPHRGFKGRDHQGQWWLACPLSDRWVVGRCDEFRFFHHKDMNPEELHDFSEEQEIKWIDQGNGVALYSSDMMANK